MALIRCPQIPLEQCGALPTTVIPAEERHPAPRYGAGIQSPAHALRQSTTGGTNPIFIPLRDLHKAILTPAKSLPRTPIRGPSLEGWVGRLSQHWLCLKCDWPDRQVRDVPFCPAMSLKFQEASAPKSGQSHFGFRPPVSIVTQAKSLPRTPIRGRYPEW